MDLKETKSEGASKDLNKSEKKLEPLKPIEKKEEQVILKKKRKKIKTIIWESIKAIWNFIITFPVWETFLNIFGSDLIFYTYAGKKNNNQIN